MLRRQCHPLVPILGSCLLSVSVAACLGQDYKRQPLDVFDAEHGWLLVVEPGEEFGLALTQNAAYPDASWQMVESDPAVATVRSSSFEPYPRGNAAQMPEDERAGVPENQLGLFIFDLEGIALGESPLVFELQADGRPIDVAEYTVAVVEDACETTVGLTAPRCRRWMPGGTEEHLVCPHGETLTMMLGEETGFTLFAHRLHPAAQWEIVEYDPELLELVGTQPANGRSAGNWEVEDDSEPPWFPATWTVQFSPRRTGQTGLRFTLEQEAELLDVCELTVEIVPAEE